MNEKLGKWLTKQHGSSQSLFSSLRALPETHIFIAFGVIYSQFDWLDTNPILKWSVCKSYGYLQTSRDWLKVKNSSTTYSKLFELVWMFQVQMPFIVGWSLCKGLLTDFIFWTTYKDVFKIEQQSLVQKILLLGFQMLCLDKVFHFIHICMLELGQHMCPFYTVIVYIPI